MVSKIKFNLATVFVSNASSRFIYNENSVNSFLNSTLRFFFLKKKFFLIKRCRLIFWDALLRRKRKDFKLQQWTDGLFNFSPLFFFKHLLKNWTMRLKQKVYLRTALTSIRMVKYRVKKRFKKLNKYNRLFVKKHLFPWLRVKDLTCFFLKIKNINKLSVVNSSFLYDINVLKPLFSMYSVRVIQWFIFKKFFYFKTTNLQLQLHMPKTQIKIAQLVLSTSIINFLLNANVSNWKSNIKKLAHVQKEVHKNYGYLGSRIRLTKDKKKNFFKIKNWQNASRFQVTDPHVIYTNETLYGQQFKRNVRIIKPSRINIKKNFFYDWRSLLLIKLFSEQYNPINLDIVQYFNLFNFRSFNWKILS